MHHFLPVCLSVCPSVYDWTKIQTGQKFTGPKFRPIGFAALFLVDPVVALMTGRCALFNVRLHF